MRRPVIGVMGSGTEPHAELSAPLGRWIAARGYHLLTGGGQGVMRAVAEAFVNEPARAGLSIGVVPGRIEQGEHVRPAGYPNDAVELAIFTHLPLSGEQGTDPLSRNHINVLSAAAIVALPGAAGTRSEVVLALRYARPVVLYGAAERFVGWPAEAQRAQTLDEVAAFVDGVLSQRLP